MKGYYLLLFFLPILAYIFILQRITLSPFHLPIPAVTHTKHNSRGDPINILILGDKKTVEALFNKAGWLIPDPTTKKIYRKNSAKIH